MTAWTKARFRELFDLTQPRIMRMLNGGWISNGRRAFVPRQLDAENIASETWRIFVEHALEGRVDEDRDPSAYVIGIAKNVALKELTKAQRITVLEVPEEVPSPATPLDLRSVKTQLIQAIDELEEPARSILLGKRAGLGEGELAEKLGLSRDQVRRRYERGLGALRRRFGVTE